MEEGEVRSKKLEWEPVITPADSYNLDSQPMEGVTYLEHPAPVVYLDSWPMEGGSYELEIRVGVGDNSGR